MRSLLILLLLGSSLSAAEPLSVGFAETDVTPDIKAKTVYMAGFGQNRMAKSVHDPIMARAVVLMDGKTRIALVAVDVVGLFFPFVETIREKLPDFDYVLVSSTHNHEGPDTLGLWGKSPFRSGVDPEYMKQLREGVVKAVLAANAKLTPATAGIGTANGPELLSDKREPYIKHDELTAIRFQSIESGKPIGIIVQWNSHPETLDDENHALSADFVAATVAHLGKKHSCPVAYFTGTVGGLLTSLSVPITDDNGVSLKDGTFEKTTRYGVKVGELADRALAVAKPVTLTPIRIHRQRILVPVENAIYRLAKTAGVLNREMYVWSGDPTPKTFTPSNDVTKPVALATEVGRLTLGELDIAAIPGEIYSELVLGKVQDPADAGADFPDAKIEPAIYPQMHNKHRMLIGLANDEIGYIIPKRQWDEKAPFCYGRSKAQYGEINSVGSEAAPILCDEFRKLAAKK